VAAEAPLVTGPQTVVLLSQEARGVMAAEAPEEVVMVRKTEAAEVGAVIGEETLAQQVRKPLVTLLDRV